MAKRDDLKRILDQVRAQGGLVEIASNGHIVVTPPDKAKRRVYTSGTPSDYRSYLNFIGDLRRVGFTIKHKGGK